jgi:hypothetical protein
VEPGQVAAIEPDRELAVVDGGQGKTWQRRADNTWWRGGDSIQSGAVMAPLNAANNGIPGPS